MKCNDVGNIGNISETRYIDRKRDKRLDMLKGFAMLSVILYHSIQRGLVINYENNWLFLLLKAYHMPLFMGISGYLFYVTNPNVNKKFFVKKFKRYLIPTVIWSYIIYFIRDFWFVGIQPFITFDSSVLHQTLKFIVYPNYVIWFLYVLFIIEMIYIIWDKVLKYKVKLDIYIYIYILIVEGLLFIIPCNYFGLSQVRLYLPIFICGYCVGQHKEFIISKLKYVILVSGILSGLMIFCNYFFNLSNRLIVSSSIFHNVYMLLDQYIKYYILAIFFISIIYLLINQMNEGNIMSKVLNHFGIWSLEYYLVQVSCLNIGVASGVLRIITIFISCIIISTVIISISKKFKTAKAILYGDF